MIPQMLLEFQVAVWRCHFFIALSTFAPIFFDIVIHVLVAYRLDERSVLYMDL